MNTEGMSLDQAKSALDRAREAHAAAMIAARDNPGNPEASQQFRNAVRSGRSAWKDYQEAATVGLAAQISAIVPSEFQGEG